MSTLQALDQEDLTEVGQDGTEERAPTCPEPFGIKDNIMNSKLLYVATLAVSLLGGLAVASGAVAAPLTGALASADLAAAVASAPIRTWSQPLLTRAASQ